MLKSVLRTSAEDLAASIATAGELSVVAIAAIDLVHLAAELFVHQGHSAPVAEEAGLVPMLILVRQILQNENPMIKLELLCVFCLTFAYLLKNVTACRAIKSTWKSLISKIGFTRRINGFICVAFATFHFSAFLVVSRSLSGLVEFSGVISSLQLSRLFVDRRVVVRYRRQKSKIVGS